MSYWSLFSSNQCIIKQLFRLSFYDIQKNRALGKRYQSWPLAQLITLNIDLDITKTSSNIIVQNNLLFLNFWWQSFEFLSKALSISLNVELYHALLRLDRHDYTFKNKDHKPSVAAHYLLSCMSKICFALHSYEKKSI